MKKTTRISRLAALALSALVFSPFVLPASASPEADLEAKLPEILAKAAAHYKALDAAVTPLMRVKGDKAKGAEGEEASEYRIPHGWNKWRTGRDEYDMRDIYWWTSGHYAGSLWLLYEGTGDAFFKGRATAWTEILKPVSEYTGNHDVGFMTYCSYGNARRILKTNRYDGILRQTAATLAKRYSPELGLIRSWGKIEDKDHFLVIPDNLMNLELMAWAGDRFAKIATSHADVTMKNHFRPDGGCYHVVDYDQATGKVRGYRQGQGAGTTTAWARGESWAIYGYTMMYRMTGLARYLAFARKLADYAMNHPNMPADGIPFWDYGRPGEERDSSAGSVMASALLELSQYVGPADRARYRAFAAKQLLALASPAYFSEGNEIGHFLLKHGVGHKPAKSEIDTPLNYGDYYFLEALLRFRALRAREGERADLRAKLPARAGLTARTVDLRTDVRKTGEKLISGACGILKMPIPDTTDELYGEYFSTGNRTHYQSVYGRLTGNLRTLVRAEAAEKKGRFLARIADYLSALCGMKSWVLPAHDWSDGERGNFRGTCLTVDLVSSDVAAVLAAELQLVADRLDPALVARVKGECERRVFAPLRRELAGGGALGAPKRLNWWVYGANNWNAVCWDNVVCAALGLLDDPEDRAFFVAGALKSMPVYLGGFAPDGYCSEGMGYWDYGYGHHLQMGLLLRAATGGKLDIFTTEIQKAVAAYARSFTLCEGLTPAFADSNGSRPDLRHLGFVDEIWPDLPKTLPPASEFPDGQVWLFREPKGLSVAFKGGHNDEFHNHNDLGSYTVAVNGKFVSGDVGGEVYTRQTFSKDRYLRSVLNSYGHPVPVVGGKLQGTGRKFAAKVVEKKVDGKKVEKADGGGERCEIVLDLAGAYDVKALKTLTRTFVYDRAAQTFTVRDHVEFSEPTAFEDCYMTLGGKPNVTVRATGRGPLAVKTVVKPDETIENPGKPTPHRFAWTFDRPVTEAEVEFVFSAAAPAASGGPRRD